MSQSFEKNDRPLVRAASLRTEIRIPAAIPSPGLYPAGKILSCGKQNPFERMLATMSP